MKRACKAVLVILAIAGIDALVYYAALWLLKTVLSAVLLLIGLAAGAYIF